MTAIARTPDDRFADLSDYRCDPTYVQVNVDGADLRLGRVDAGPVDAHPFVLLWGERDPVLPPKIGQRMADLIPGTDRFVAVEGSHFLQEDAGPQIGRDIAAFIALGQ